MAFKKGQLQVLAHAWDRNLGGRNFDEVLFEHFVKEFNAKYKLDITSNARASFRLRLSCEKVQTFGKRCVRRRAALCVCDCMCLQPPHWTIMPGRAAASARRSLCLTYPQALHATEHRVHCSVAAASCCLACLKRFHEMMMMLESAF